MMRNVVCVNSFHDVGDSRTMPYPYTLAAALLLTRVCIFGGRLRARSHHRRWISIAAGVSVASIFVDLLPTISEKQAKFSANAPARAALFQGLTLQSALLHPTADR